MNLASRELDLIESARHRSHPQRAVMVVEQRHDAVVREAQRRRVVPVAALGAGAGVDLDEPRADRAHPDPTGAVVGEAADIYVVERSAAVVPE